MNITTNNKNVLILSSRYGISDSANAICAKNIADEMAARGYTVTVITSSGKDKDDYSCIDGVEVYGLKQSFYSSLLKRKQQVHTAWFSAAFRLISVFRHVFNFFVFPDISPLRSRRVYYLAKKLIQQKNIGVLLSTYRPYESIYTALRIKRERPDITVIDFQLDILSEPYFPNTRIKKILSKRAALTTQKEIQVLDKVILPESEKASAKYSEVLYSEFPVYIPDSKVCQSDFEFDPNYIHAAYIGSISRENRDPQYMLNLVKQYNARYSPKIMIDLWGSIEPAVLHSIAQEKCVTYWGILEHQFVSDILRKTDFVINLSNSKTTQMVPSKIFQEFASRRPIINFLKSEDDCTIPYFQKYGYVIFCNEQNGSAAFIEKFYEQVKKYLGAEIPPPKELLEKCTPEYFVNLLETCVTMPTE